MTLLVTFFFLVFIGLKIRFKSILQYSKKRIKVIFLITKIRMVNELKKL